MTAREVTWATHDDADAILAFAAQHPLSWTDFESYAIAQPAEPRLWITRAYGDPDVAIDAAAIDDGLTMSVAGAPEALRAIAARCDIPSKLVISGRVDDVGAFVGAEAAARRQRAEHFMAVHRAALRRAVDPAPLRVATAADLPMLVRSRTAALEEEYDIPVPRGSALYHDLSDAVERAVALQGVAVWVEDGECAFTAQLVTKTPAAAMFGDLYVAPGLRGSGRATRGLATFCDWLMTESEHVVLRVDTGNDPALRLYDRVGFSAVDRFCSSLGVDSVAGSAAPDEGRSVVS